MKYTLYSWNVNGLRATVKKGFLKWLKTSKGDVICLQETKAHAEQLTEDVKSPKFEKLEMISHFSQPVKKGYSGVATYIKKSITLKSYSTSLDVAEFDNEGRVMITKFDQFTLLNVYFPNGKKNQERLDYKMRFYEHFMEFCNDLRKNGEKLVICGDVNTAHTEFDLENDKPNAKYSGFLPIERKWMDRLFESGYIDTYRHLHPEKKKGAYTWWSMRSKTAKFNNVGWRLDYFIISDDLVKNLVSASIFRDTEGSDHCPISIELQF